MSIIQWVAQAYSEKGNLSAFTRRRALDLPITTSSDALPLSYVRLVGAKAIKLGSWVLNVNVWHMLNGINVVV